MIHWAAACIEISANALGQSFPCRDPYCRLEVVVVTTASWLVSARLNLPHFLLALISAWQTHKSAPIVITPSIMEPIWRTTHLLKTRQYKLPFRKYMDEMGGQCQKVDYYYLLIFVRT